MQVGKKGQITIFKHIRTVAGVLPGSEVEFALEGGKIIISKVVSGIGDDRRERLIAAAARVRASMPSEFRAMSADEMMEFLRPRDPAGR